MSDIPNLRNNINRSNSNDNDQPLGSASDYILIAMIVVMMLCMAVCCLCLFCRSANRNISFCGYTCEVNNDQRNASIAAEDVSELHEVEPLTPALVTTYDLPDIENKLKSDPPPPNYNEVASSSMFDRFRWKSKRKTVTSNEESNTGGKIKESVSRNKSRRSERQSRFSRTIQRSISQQHPHKPHTKTSTGFSFRFKGSQGNKHATFPSERSLSHGASIQPSKNDVIISIPDSVKEETTITKEELAKTKNECPVDIAKNVNTISNIKNETVDVYDDEVFM